MSNPFWHSAEVDAASRDFEYEDYRRLCLSCGWQPLCEEAYRLCRAAFNAQHDHDQKIIT